MTMSNLLVHTKHLTDHNCTHQKDVTGTVPVVSRHLAACLERQSWQRFVERPTYRRLAPSGLGGTHNLSHCKVVDESNDAESQQVSQDISHCLLLEQGAPNDVAAAAQENQGEDHLAEGQQDESAKTD